MIKMKKSHNGTFFVGSTGFEPVTFAMSTQRSKPTELTARPSSVKKISIKKPSEFSDGLLLLLGSNQRPSD